MMSELSQQAKDVCIFFTSGEKSTVVSQPPHATMNKVRDGLNELLAAGIVTEKPYNKFGVIEYRGTEKSSEIGRAVMADPATADRLKGAATPPEEGAGR